jgi:ribosomal protein S19
MRSLWKGYYYNTYNIKSLNNIITTLLINKTLSLYNGKKIFNILIKINMLYLKIGSLIFTRKIVVKHKKKEKKNIKLKKK